MNCARLWPRCLASSRRCRGPARNDAGARDRFLTIMREQGLRMARLVDDLLSLSRIELRAHLAPETPVDLAGISREIVDSLALMRVSAM